MLLLSVAMVLYFFFLFVKRAGATAWTYLDSTIDYETYKITAVNDKIIYTWFSNLKVTNSSDSYLGSVTGYTDAFPLEADVDSDGRYWIADANRLIIR